MSDREWEKFFELMGKIINLPNLTAMEKAALVREKAEQYASGNDLEEFATYAGD